MGSPQGLSSDPLLDLQAQIQVQQEMLLSHQQQMMQLQHQLQDAFGRAARAEEERSIALRLAGSQKSELVDTKGVGQPFKFSGKSDQDFSEWVYKFKTFAKAKFGGDVEVVLSWAGKQRKTIVKEAHFGETKVVTWNDVFGSAADDIEKIDDVDGMLEGLGAYLTSFTTGDANKVVRNSGTDSLEAWRRLINEYDPTSSMRRVTILSMVQNPNKCKSVEELGSSLEHWLTKKKQYEEFTDNAGNPCVVSDDSLIAGLYRLMPESLEETFMLRADEFSDFESFFDKLSSYATTRHSLNLSRRELGSSRNKGPKDDPMELGALMKGGKGKGGKAGNNANKMTCHACGKLGHKASECRSKGGGKTSNKGDPPKSKRMDNVQCWVCMKYGHYGKDCWSNTGKGKGKSGQKGKFDGGSKKGKGKGGSANSVEDGRQSSQQPEKEPELSHLDLSAIGDGEGEHFQVYSPLGPEEEREEDALFSEVGGASGGPTAPGSEAVEGEREDAEEETVEASSQRPRRRVFTGVPSIRASQSRDRAVGVDFSRTPDWTPSIPPGLTRNGDDSRTRSRSRGGGPAQGSASVHEDVDHNSMNTEHEDGSPTYLCSVEGEEWLKLNYDSGAVSTVIPIEMAVAQGLQLRRVGDYRVANGEKIPRYGRVRVPCIDEQGHRRGFKATVTHVHKPGSAGEFSATHDAYIFDDGGWLIPRNTSMAQAMRAFLRQLIDVNGERGMLKLYKEGNLYNIYLKQRGDLQELGTLDSDSASSGNERQAMRP